MSLNRRELLMGMGAAAVVGALGGCRAEAAGGAPKTKGALELDNVVAGSEGDYMIARHIRLRGPNRAVGHDLAQIAATRHGSKAEATESIAAKARQLFYQRNHPEHWERSIGAAEALGLSADETEVDITQVGFNMDPGVGCSVVYYPGSSTQAGSPVLSRNFDFSTGTINDMVGAPPNPKNRPMLADPYIVEAYPDKGYPSLYISAYDLLGGCVDGINSEGLCVALLADDYSMNTYGLEPAESPVGLGVLQVGRYLLDHCRTVEEAKVALKAAKQYYTIIPCHYIIGDADGNSCVWEYSHMHNNEYITDGKGKPQTVTNHPLFLEESQATQFPESFGRRKRMQDEIALAGDKLSLDQIKYTNACVAAANPHYSGRTIWHSLYNCAERSMQVSFYLGDDNSGVPRRSDYLTFQLKG